jgi:hypothetical protein
MKIDKSQLRVRHGFLLGLFVVFVIIPLIASLLLPVYAPSGKLMAKLHLAHDEEIKISFALNQHAAKIGGITDVDVNFVHDALLDTNGNFLSKTNTQGQIFNLWRVPLNRTNAQGQILDLWKIPYQIEIVARTNFIIRSAGPDKVFGDRDDIVFNSVSNDFVKP